jgi:RimJ/RimL family protein N-acetyltransferase
MVTVPVIETERLRLRGHRMEDFAPCAAMWADPVVTRYFGGKIFTEEEVWTRVLRYVGHWQWMGFGYWAGELGFADYKREIQPSIQGIPEAGWVLASDAHGKGYATEAVRAVVEWGERRFGNVETVCLIHPDNRASIRVAEKCGYRERQVATYHGQPTVLFAR